jgi:hypothetical protein
MIKRLADAQVKTQEKKVDLPGNAVIAGRDRWPHWLAGLYCYPLPGELTWVGRTLHGALYARQQNSWASRTHGNEIGDNRRALTILAETASCRHQGRDRSGRCSAERHRQQARAQEHEAGRRQGKKSVGDNVVVAHETPTTPDVRPNLLKLSKFHVEIVRPSI